MAETIKIKHARLSFPDLFQTSSFQGTDTGKYGCTFLISKEKQRDQLKAIKAAEKRFLEETFGDNTPKGLKFTYWADGDDKDYDGYAGNIAIRASSRKRILTIDKDRTPVTEQDNLFYGGCYVNGLVSFWYSEHPAGGKQILMNVSGVQFYRDGEAFGSYTAATTDDFEDESEDGDESQDDDYDSF
jgi:hypothetical protein